MGRKRGGYGTGEMSYKHVVKMRVNANTYNKLVELQESRGLCMAQLLRELVNKGLKVENTEKQQT